MIKFLDLATQYQTIKDDIDEAIANVIQGTAFIGGTYVKQFEEDFKNWLGAQYCIGVGNGTDGLEIALEALDLPKGSEIIVPANSFISTAEAVTRTGHKVVFCDVDEGHYTLTPEHIKPHLTDKTKAIMAVHLYGHPCDMDALKKLAKEHDLKIIEDCAQAHGACYKAQKIGTIGDIASFSFYPGKNLGAYGDGGAITTQSEKLAIKARMIANHGRIAKYNHEFEGRNSRLDGLQAAILSVKLKHLDQWTKQRVKIADAYLESLKDIPHITLPKRANWAYQVYHLFVIRTHQRDALQDFLKQHNIQTGIHYPIALPKLKAYHYLGQKNADFFTHKSDIHLLSLPIGEHLTLKDVHKVTKTIKEFFK